MDIKKLFDLSGRIVIITGAAGNLGSKYAEGLTQAGANVVLADIDYATCKQLGKQLENKYSIKNLAIKLDLNDKSSIENMVSKTMKQFSKIDILINNAAYQGNSKSRKIKFENFPLNEWNKAVSVNLTGVFLTCQEVGKIMVKQKYGNIINISSTYGLVAPDQRIYGTSGQNAAAFYSATKAALVNLTRYLASYWNRSGIRVNSLSPGGVENSQESNFIKKYSEKTMLGRMANKNEYVGAIIFLSSDASSYMTGSNLIVDGGWTAW
ncbi:MAG: short-chain dehydrogenase [Thaumarchaeota archaeon]|jgi:NAD(P)-dependent dehydrogenase (short-subunit alcohol dehydrogenase family)|nr:MAG: short-chain dehydrogenase [Nitrososphaerota archaeon]